MEQSEREIEIEIKAITRPEQPVLRTWVGLGARYGQQVVTTGFSMARDVHAEWKERVRDVLDTVESTQRGVTGLFRRLSGHLDTIIEDTIKLSEDGAMSLVRSVSSTADDAARIAARSGALWVGSDTEQAA